MENERQLTAVELAAAWDADNLAKKFNGRILIKYDDVKRKVTAAILDGETIIGIASAKFAIGSPYSEEIGKAVAIRRVLKRDVPIDYIQGGVIDESI